MGKFLTTRDILSHYESYDELGRLGRGVGALEFARMHDLIGRVLAPPPGVVLDVGGGPGRYACWLAAKGYQIHLVEQEETLLGTASHMALVAEKPSGDRRPA